jgi:hypothetical protein
MKTVTESIFDNGRVVVPMARVSHIERCGSEKQYMRVVMDCSTWNNEANEYNNAVHLDKEEGEAFLAAWCTYRGELESESLVDFSKQSLPQARDKTKSKPGLLFKEKAYR